MCVENSTPSHVRRKQCDVTRVRFGEFGLSCWCSGADGRPTDIAKYGEECFGSSSSRDQSEVKGGSVLAD